VTPCEDPAVRYFNDTPQIRPRVRSGMSADFRRFPVTPSWNFPRKKVMKTIIRAVILALSAATFNYHAWHSDHAAAPTATQVAVTDPGAVNTSTDSGEPSFDPANSFTFVPDSGLPGNPLSSSDLNVPVTLQLQAPDTGGLDRLNAKDPAHVGDHPLIGLLSAAPKSSTGFQLFNPHAPVVIPYRPIYMHGPPVPVGMGQYRVFGGQYGGMRNGQFGGMRSGQFQIARPQSFRAQGTSGGGGYQSGGGHAYCGPMR